MSTVARVAIVPLQVLVFLLLVLTAPVWIAGLVYFVRTFDA